MKELSIIIPSYNNLRHLKNCYHSIRRWYPELELVILDDNSDDGTLEWIGDIMQDDDNIVPQYFDERHGHTVLYDAGVTLAQNDIVGIIHADMLVTKNTFENMLKHLEKGKVVCATRIEPPLHPSGAEKIIKDFGQDFDTLDIPAFEQFAQRMEKEYKDETTNGMFAPWILYKEDYKRIGGHDHIFAPFPYEDSDIFQRWILEGYELIQARDSFVYHLTCRGHKWNEEIGKLDDGFEEHEERARRNYIRKWGTWIQNDEHQHPIIFRKYDIGFVIGTIKDSGMEELYHYEPWCSDIYITADDTVREAYTDVEEKATEWDIESKVHGIDETPDNDVVIEFPTEVIGNETFTGFIQKINQIIDNYEEGEYEWNGFTIKINKKQSYPKEHYKPIYKKEL